MTNKIYNLDAFNEYFDRSESSQELVMLYSIDHGIIFGNSEYEFIFENLTYYILGQDKHLFSDEQVLKAEIMINDLIVDMDVVNSSNTSFFIPKMCSLILDIKDKNSIMPSFKHLCNKFPMDIKKEYLTQKSFREDFL